MGAFIGALFCAYQNNWLIICFPHSKQHEQLPDTVPSSVEKKVVLTWWHDTIWQTESAGVVWPSDKNSALQVLVSAWLALLYEENSITKLVTVQTAMFSRNGNTVYLSFDRYPLDKQASLYDKLRWFDGLSKTIMGNGLSCTHIQLLVKHAPLVDAHLDFSRPWPVTGFIEQLR